jgi:hypothetical protein
MKEGDTVEAEESTEEKERKAAWVKKTTDEHPEMRRIGESKEAWQARTAN